jgi:hypothetical protein
MQSALIMQSGPIMQSALIMHLAAIMHVAVIMHVAAIIDTDVPNLGQSDLRASANPRTGALVRPWMRG